MSDSEVFDRWADNYDDDVAQSDQAETFPFAGYGKVLDTISRKVLSRKPGHLLDIGTGSGILAARFYHAGWEVTALDFSEEMLRQARQRMPAAKFILSDFSNELSQELSGMSFDFITMTYALHHLRYEKQAEFIRSLIPLLRENGRIMVGDIAFETLSDLEACQKRFPGEWDEDEYYPILTETEKQLSDLQVHFEVVSFCAGIVEVSPIK